MRWRGNIYGVEAAFSKKSPAFNIQQCCLNFKIRKLKAKKKMPASSTARLAFRIATAVIVILVLFYVGRPLYWKISATVQEIRENKQTVKQGLNYIKLLPVSISDC